MKVGIIGNGLVGSTAAYAIVMRRAASEVVLVDADTKRAEAEAADISHAIPFLQPVEIYAGSYADLKNSKVIIIAAGVNQKPGESRLALLERNAAILKSIIPQVVQFAPGAVLLIATNPVDILTHLAANFAGKLGVSSSKVIGTGTTLDTSRFRMLLGKLLGVDAQHVHGYVIGEHGDSEVLTWSTLDVAGLMLDEFTNLRNIKLDESVKLEIDKQVRFAAYNIIEGKGATYYGIGAGISRIVDVIGRDNRAIMTICTPMNEVEGVEDITMSLPHLVGGEGSMATLPLRLNDFETGALKRSAKILRDMIDEYEKRIQ